MKTTLLATLLCTFLFCTAQEEKASQGKFRIGAFVSPDIAYRRMKSLSSDPIIQSVAASMNAREIAKVSYSAGLNLSYRLNKHLQLETGLGYTNKGYQSRQQLYVYSNQPLQQAPWSFESIFSAHYLNVPLRMHLLLGEKRLKFDLSAGLNTQLLLAMSSVTRIYQDDNVTKTHNIAIADYQFSKAVGLAPEIGAGILYELSSRYQLQVQPYFSYGLISLDKGSIFSRHFWSTGIMLGAYYRL